MNQRYDASLLNFPPTPSSCLSVYFWFMHCSVCRLHLNNQGGKIDMLGRVLSQLFKIQNVEDDGEVTGIHRLLFLVLRLGECESKQTLWKPVGKPVGKPAHQSPPLGPSRFLHLDSLSCLRLRPTCASVLVLGTLSPLGLQCRNLGIPSATPSLWTLSYFMYPPSVSFLSSPFLKLKCS